MKIKQFATAILCMILVGCLLLLNIRSVISQSLLNAKGHITIHEESKLYSKIEQALTIELSQMMSDYQIPESLAQSLVPQIDIQQTLRQQTDEIIHILKQDGDKITPINPTPYIDKLRNRVHETTYQGVFIRKDIDDRELNEFFNTVSNQISSHVNLLNEEEVNQIQHLEFIYYISSSVFLVLTIILAILIFIILGIVWRNKKIVICYLVIFSLLSIAVIELTIFFIQHNHHYLESPLIQESLRIHMKELIMHRFLHHLFLNGSYNITFVCILLSLTIIFETLRERTK